MAGQCAKRFGSGEVTRPMEFYVGILPAGTKLEDLDTSIRSVVEVEIGRMREFRSELIRGAYPIC